MGSLLRFVTQVCRRPAAISASRAEPSCHREPRRDRGLPLPARARISHCGHELPGRRASRGNRPDRVGQRRAVLYRGQNPNRGWLAPPETAVDGAKRRTFSRSHAVMFGASRVTGPALPLRHRQHYFSRDGEKPESGSSSEHSGGGRGEDLSRTRTVAKISRSRPLRSGEMAFGPRRTRG